MALFKPTINSLYAIEKKVQREIMNVCVKDKYFAYHNKNKIKYDQIQQSSNICKQICNTHLMHEQWQCLADFEEIFPPPAHLGTKKRRFD